MSITLYRASLSDPGYAFATSVQISVLDDIKGIVLHGIMWRERVIPTMKNKNVCPWLDTNLSIFLFFMSFCSKKCGHTEHYIVQSVNLRE